MNLLWASDGTEYCLSTAPVVRQLLLPSADRVDVLSVAPLHDIRAGLNRLIGGTEKQEVAKAEAAARASIEALGKLNVEVRREVRWGPTSQEIVKQATDTEADIIALGAKPFNAFRQAIMDDTAMAVVKATFRSVLLTRPPVSESPRALVLLCNPSAWLQPALDLLGRLELSAQTRIYLAAFTKPVRPVGGLFFSYSEYREVHSQAFSAVDRDAVQGALNHASQSLAAHGYATETVISDGSADEELGRLAAEVSAAAMVIGATPYAAGFFSSTADALNAALRAPCSVLVAR